eukprot:gene48748-biopygen21506
MLTGLREFAPELLHWFLWSYGRTSPLFYQGEHVADVSTGCKQGDPLSSLCFAVGLQDALRQVQTVIAELVDSEETIGCSKLGGIYSFVDDTNIFCDARIANRVAVAVRTVFKTCRLILSPTKCKFLVRADTVLPDEGLNQFGVERNGIVIMGNPIGTERAGYIARVSEIGNNMDPFMEFDAAI